MAATSRRKSLFKCSVLSWLGFFVLNWFECFVLRSNGSICSLRPFLCFVSVLTTEQRLRRTGKYRSTLILFFIDYLTVRLGELETSLRLGFLHTIEKIKLCVMTGLLLRTVEVWDRGKLENKRVIRVALCRSVSFTNSVDVLSSQYILGRWRWWVVGGVPWVKGRPPPGQLQVWGRPPGAGAGHHWYLYTEPRHRLYGRQTIALHHTLCAHNPAVLFIRQQREIEVVQQIVKLPVALASGAGPQIVPRRLKRRTAPIKG